jgi:hypothetical protein
MDIIYQDLYNTSFLKNNVLSGGIDAKMVDTTLNKRGINNAVLDNNRMHLTVRKIKLYNPPLLHFDTYPIS